MEQNELVFVSNGQAVTTSLKVAETFKKSHDNVLKSIRSILSRGIIKSNDTPIFEEATYVNYQNKQEYPMFIMNFDAFTLLAMGFNGKKAMEFKLQYINAFNSMKNKLEEKATTPVIPKTSAEMLLMYAQQMVDQERRVANVENRLDAIEKEREENGRLLLTAELSNEGIPSMTLRAKVNQLARQYSVANNIRFNDVWHKVYEQLYYLYHISVKQYKKSQKESYLDVAERNKFLDKIYNILSNMVREAVQ